MLSSETDNPVTFEMPDAAVSVKAVFVANTYTVTFDLNYTTTAAPPAPITTGADGRLASLPPDPTRAATASTSYSFNGWYTSGGTKVIAGAEGTVFDASVTVYARWASTCISGCGGNPPPPPPPPEPTVITVTFDPRGGTVNPTSATAGTNGRLSSLPTPKRDATATVTYTFSGWFTTPASASGKQVTTSTEFTASTTIYARWTQNTSIAGHDREVPADVGGGAVVLPPDNSVVGADGNRPALVAGPNPVARSEGLVKFFRQGKRVDNATLTVYDASGNVINKIKVVDNALGTQDRRQVAEWDLRDAKGALVSEGSYLVRGVVKTSDGKKDKVSVVVGVR
jgi:hypothetical protein